MKRVPLCKGSRLKQREELKKEEELDMPELTDKGNRRGKLYVVDIDS